MNRLICVVIQEEQNRSWASRQMRVLENCFDSVELVSALNGEQLFDNAMEKIDDQSTVALIDEHSDLNQSIVVWSVEQLVDADLVATYAGIRLEGTLCQKMWSWLVVLFSRFLFGTRKCRYSAGITFIRGDALCKVTALELVKCPSQLIGAAVSNGLLVREVALSGKNVSHRAASVRTSICNLQQDLRFWWQEIAFPRVRYSEAYSADSKWSPKQWLLASLVIAIAALVIFGNLGYPLLEPDETRNAQLGLNIIESGDWFSLSLDGEPHWDKPPLQAWMTAISYQVFGESPFAARLPLALVSFGTLLTLLFLGSQIFNFRTGITAAVALTFCIGFLVAARYLTMDASLCCFATLMFMAIQLAVRSDTIRNRWLVVAGIAFGLGLLVKGPVIGVIVIPPVFIYGWLEQKKWIRLPQFWIYLFVPAFAIAAPWFVVMSISQPEFVEHFFWKHHVVRFTDAFNHEQPWWYYVPVIIGLSYPAVFLMPNLLKIAFKKGYTHRIKRTPVFGALLVYPIWIISFFSMSQAKLPTYILPALPILCLLAGRALEITLASDVTNPSSEQWILKLSKKFAISVSLMTLVVSTFAIFWLEFDKSILFLSLPLVLGAIYLHFGIRQNSKTHVGVATAIFGAIFVGLSCGCILPEFATERSSQAAVQRLLEQPGHRNKPVVFFGRPPRSTSFELPNVRVHHFDNDCRTHAICFLKANPRSLVIASKSDITMLTRELDSRIVFDKSPSHRRIYTSKLSTIPSQASRLAR